MSARAARADDDLSKTEKNTIEIIDTVEPGDRVLFNDRVQPLTVGRVSARRPTSKTVTVRLEGPQGGSYSLVHSQGGYGGESVNLRRNLGYNDEGRPVFESMKLESIELVAHQKFRIGQVYETEEPIVGDEYYHVVTDVPDSGCYDVETVTIRVDDDQVADVKESGFFYSHDKPKIFDGGLDLVDEIGIGYSGDRGIYYDVEREEEICLSGPHERGIDLRPTEGHGLEVVSWDEILLGFEDRFKKPMTDGGIAVGSYEDLGPREDQPVDRNPSLSCRICGESYKWQDYWKERILSQDADPREVPLWCDECEEEIEELRRLRSENADLSEWDCSQNEGPTDGV